MQNSRFPLIILCCIVILPSGSLISPTGAYHDQSMLNVLTDSSTTNTFPFNYVVSIVMENQGLCNIVPTLLAACSNNVTYAPFMTSLANSSSLAENYTGITHPSLSNYLSLLSGQDWGCARLEDPAPNSDPCTASAWNSTNSNLIDRLEASGFTWKAYMEDYPSNCGSNCSPGGCFLGERANQYAVRHDPFLYFSDIADIPSRCSRIVPSGENATNLLNDLGSTATASNFMWLTPNLCNDMHDDCTTNATSPIMCEGGGNKTNTINCLRQGDTYLSRLVPMILGSYIFTTQRAALFLTFDEGNGFCPMNQNHKDDCLYTIWTGPVVKKHYVSSNSYSHLSFLSTIEAAWNLQPLTSNDTSTPAMAEFFTNVFPPHFKSNPVSPEVDQITQFNTTTGGGTGPYSFTWKFGDNSTGSGNFNSHAYSSAGQYSLTVNATDSLGRSASFTRNVIVVNHPTVTIDVSPSRPVLDEQVNLTAIVTDGEAPFFYQWSLGDGSSSAGQSISHQYDISGPIKVQVKITDLLGFSSNYTQTVNVTLRSSSILVDCSPNSVMINETATCKASVTDSSRGTPSIPSGTVSFLTDSPNGTFDIQQCHLVEGTCQVTYAQSVSGMTDLRASYDGDSNHDNGSVVSTIAVTLRSTSMTVTCPRNGTVGIALSCGIFVFDTGSGPPSIPLGKISFSSGESCTLSKGSCSIGLNFSATGIWSVLGSYTPSDASHTSSTASQWFAIRSTPLEVIDQPTNICILSFCYTEALWTWVLIGTIFVAGSMTTVGLRKHSRKRHAQTD